MGRRNTSTVAAPAPQAAAAPKPAPAPAAKAAAPSPAPKPPAPKAPSPPKKEAPAPAPAPVMVTPEPAPAPAPAASITTAPMKVSVGRREPEPRPASAGEMRGQAASALALAPSLPTVAGAAIGTAVLSAARKLVPVVGGAPMSVVDESARQAVRETMMRNRAERAREQTLSDVAASYGRPGPGQPLATAPSAPTKPTKPAAAAPARATTAAPAAPPAPTAAPASAPVTGLDAFQQQKLAQVAELRRAGQTGMAGGVPRGAPLMPGAVLMGMSGRFAPRISKAQTEINVSPKEARSRTITATPSMEAMTAPLDKPEEFARQMDRLGERFAELRRAQIQLGQAKAQFEGRLGQSGAEDDLAATARITRSVNQEMAQTLADLNEYGVTPQEAAQRYGSR